MAGLSWSEAKESRKIAADAHSLSQKSYDRSAGKIGARFKVVSFSPIPNNLPPEMIVHRKEEKSLRLSSLKHLRMVNLRMNVRNTGEEPIDAIRLESKVLLLGVASGGKLKTGDWGALASWRHDSVATEEYILGRKLMPGETANQSGRGVRRARSHSWGEVLCSARDRGTQVITGSVVVRPFRPRGGVTSRFTSPRPTNL